MGLFSSFTGLVYTSCFGLTHGFGKVTDFLKTALTHRLMGLPHSVLGAGITFSSNLVTASEYCRVEELVALLPGSSNM